ncbi:hypothetical protein [Oligoflexus tunisiensis]|uniref:hypothetical protein n=1 Tax=Oligoflexus tunisiensis TaxID=708132 RepID=UPI00114CCF1B|nr:hypothetical protein [Oligoflexus tunisiensis]
MRLQHARKFSIFVLIPTMISTAAQAQGGNQWVDFLSQSKICAANWTWTEIRPSTTETITNNCEKRTVTVLDRDAPPSRGLSPVIAEVLIGSGQANVETPDLQEARRRAVELVVAEYVKQGYDKNIYKEPGLINPSYLDASYAYYGQLVGSQKVPDDAILPPKGIAKEGWSCGTGVVGVTGRPLQPSDCGKIRIEVDVFGQYHPVTYTLPTKQIQENVNPSCQETEIKHHPAKMETGMSDIFMSLTDVSDATYASIKGNSMTGAVKSRFECPHGIHLDEPRTQLLHALDWIRKQPQPLDASSESVAATIRYLKALALEKAEALTPDHLRSVLQLHKDFPQLAFAGQETLDTAVETAAEDILANRKKWEEIEKKYGGTPQNSSVVGAQVLAKLSEARISKNDNMLTVEAYAEQRELVVQISRRHLAKVFRINVDSETVSLQSTPYMQETTATTVEKRGSSYSSLIQDLLTDLAILRDPNSTGEELYQYVNGLVSPTPSAADTAAAKLMEQVGVEQRFRADMSAENYTPVMFRIVPGSGNLLARLQLNSRSGFTEVEFFKTRDISVERNHNGQKSLLSFDTAEYNALLDELIQTTSTSQDLAIRVGPANVLPHFEALLNYLNALRAASR